MKELIPKDQYGIFADTHDTARVDSLYVSEFFDKKHKTVLRNIDAILSPDSGFSAEFGRHNFVAQNVWQKRSETGGIPPAGNKRR